MGFRKRVVTEVRSRESSMIRIRVQIFSMGKVLKIFADERKGGFEIGDFIKFDKRGNYEVYKGIEGLSCVVRNKEFNN